MEVDDELERELANLTEEERLEVMRRMMEAGEDEDGDVLLEVEYDGDDDDDGDGDGDGDDDGGDVGMGTAGAAGADVGVGVGVGVGVEDADSGDDTDELISAARSSGALKRAQGAQKKKKKKRKRQEDERATGAQGKQRRVEDSGSATGSASASSASAGTGTSSGTKEIDMESSEELDFTFFDPRPEDYHSVKRFLVNYIPSPADSRFPAEELTELVCNQVVVGTMIKSQTVDEEPLGFITALNLRKHKDAECIKRIKSFVLQHCPADLKGKLESILAAGESNTNKPVGLLIQDRLLNIPSELVPDLHQALVDDIAWAQANEVTAELREAYKFDKFLMISRKFYDRDAHTEPHHVPKEEGADGGDGVDDDDEDGDEEGEGNAPGNATATAAGSSSSSSSSKAGQTKDGTSCLRFEEELYASKAILKFDVPIRIPVPSTPLEKLPLVLTVMVFDKDVVRDVALQSSLLG